MSGQAPFASTQKFKHAQLALRKNLIENAAQFPNKGQKPLKSQ